MPLDMDWAMACPEITASSAKHAANIRQELLLTKAVELRSTGQPRAAVPTWTGMDIELS